MKHSNTLISLATALLLTMTTTVMAASDEEAALQAEEKELQAQLEAVGSDEAMFGVWDRHRWRACYPDERGLVDH